MFGRFNSINKNFKRKDTDENRNLAFNFAVKYLSIRNRSTKEIYDYLIRKHFIDDTINPTLKKLTDLKFLNDEEFGRAWIESRQKYKGKSKLVLKQELKIKGISDQSIQTALTDAADDYEVAKQLFERKKKVYARYTGEEFKKKMGGFLQRRGFSYSIIKKLLDLAEDI
ncbi:MAG TPA: regulatory protein RecX [Patescibacteria group bacterium]|nr:regulatory protein RecX [Patescibacteria group bacterium]